MEKQAKQLKSYVNSNSYQIQKHSIYLNSLSQTSINLQPVNHIFKEQITREKHKCVPLRKYAYKEKEQIIEKWFHS